jgi:hypothetical protein
MQSLVPANSTQPQQVSFAQLYEQLTRAQQDRSLYQQMYGQVYRVQLQQYGPKEYFNIDKCKKRSKQDDRKVREFTWFAFSVFDFFLTHFGPLHCSYCSSHQYEYVMGAKFHGGSGTTVLSCRVDSTILEPHFKLPPTEMRNLNKTDKDMANNLVREGGRAVQVLTQSIAPYEVSLLLSPDEFFAQPTALDNGKNPVLVLRKRLE